MFDKTKEIFHGMRELTDEIDQNYLIYYFKDDTRKKRFYYFNNGIEHFQKIKSGEMKLEEKKKQQNKFKSSLNKIPRGNSNEEGKK